MAEEQEFLWEIVLFWLPFYLALHGAWDPFLKSPETFRVTKISLYLQ